MPSGVYTPVHGGTSSCFSIADLPYDVVAKTGLPGLMGVMGTDYPEAYQAHGMQGVCWVKGPKGQIFQESNNPLSYNNITPEGEILTNALTAFRPISAQPKPKTAEPEKKRTKENKTDPMHIVLVIFIVILVLGALYGFFRMKS